MSGIALWSEFVTRKVFMTLTKKMIVGVLTILLIVFLGTFSITFNNDRIFFGQQMNNNAQDTATSLGLSLSHALGSKDKAAMLSMVEAVFDRGYFSTIEVRDNHGDLLVYRYEPKRGHAAPEWFVELMQWPASLQSALIMDGWQQVGEVLVNSDSSYAHEVLWNSFLELATWYFLCALIAIVIGYLSIRWLLKPLHRISGQAEAICAREFSLEATIPRTPELKKLTVAMNQMVESLKKSSQEQIEQMESLRHHSFQDTLTGVGNRRYFLLQLFALLNRDEYFCPGFVIQIAIQGLEPLNQLQGYQQGDKLLQEIARLCKKYWNDKPSATIARINGSNFAIIVKENDNELFIKHCEEFNHSLQALATTDLLIKIYAATASYQLHETANTLLTELDQVLLSARVQDIPLVYSKNVDNHQQVTINPEELLILLTQKKIKIYTQIITNGQLIFHEEVFIRIVFENKLINAGYFMPIAEREGFAQQIDSYVLNNVIDEKLCMDSPIALNLNESTVSDSKYQKVYLKQLKRLPVSYRTNLAIELNETIVINHFNQVVGFVKQLKILGIKVGVDQVGIHFLPMHYLNELPLNYLKLHGSLIHDIDKNQNKQFFIHYFSEMAAMLDIQLIVTQIENENQWQILKKMGIQWGQGNYLGLVEPIKKIKNAEKK